MSRVLVVVVVACAVRAEEYAGGAMPQYGGADYERAGLADDYRGRSPDAPAPLDYKYEEEQPQGETEKSPKYVKDADRWRKPGRVQQRRPARDDAKEELELQGNDADSDAIPQSQTSRRRYRHRMRGRRDKSRRDEAPPPRHAVTAAARHGRADHDDEHAINYLDNIDYNDESSKYREDSDLPSRETTARVVRRKQRDRMFAPPPPMSIPAKNSGVIGDEEEKSDRRSKGVKFVEPEYWSGDERDRPMGRMRPTRPDTDPMIGSDTEHGNMEPGRNKPVAYQDYNDYYNAKKLEQLKTKLPTLLRRTTTTAPPMWITTRSPAPGALRPLWPERRFGAGDAPPVYSEPATEHVPPSTPPPPPPSPITAAPVISTTTIAPALPVTAPTNNTELSLAELSRLSILKKSQMKESVKNPGTKKPPVLLHVTSRVPTVVMVEPPSSGDPWMRARPVSGDSPETLDKVKRLMRQKLVAGAKSIRDLTDNWDDTVCDYIDVSLLDGPSAAAAAAPPAPCPRAVCALLASFVCLLIMS